jgi:HSP20 family protein
MRFGTHRGNYGYEPFFKAWANAANANCGKDWQKWQEHWQEKMQYSTPAVNIVENETNFTIEVAAPGLQKEDFKIEVKHNSLTVWTEVKAQENEKKYSRKEFGYGNFKRNFTLPETVDTDNISAKYTDGILYVNIPKLEQAKTSKSVNIE